MNVLYSTASFDQDLHQILSLQRVNHFSSVTQDQAARDGFVTVIHSFELLKQMNDAAPQVIATAGDRLAGYALVMVKTFEDMIPVLKPMFNRLSAIEFRKKKITEYRFYIMGQICVAESYRGRGVFDGLYQKHRQLYKSDFDLCVTSVSARNLRSMKAHERVGFEVVNTFRDASDEWNILVWDWTSDADH